MGREDLNYRRGRSGAPLARVKADVYATETHCCICGEEVDKTLPHLNPVTGKVNRRSKTIEHTDIYNNPYDVHLAHWECNVSKGGREGAAITNARKLAGTEIHSSPGWE